MLMCLSGHGVPFRQSYDVYFPISSTKFDQADNVSRMRLRVHGENRSGGPALAALIDDSGSRVTVSVGGSILMEDSDVGP